MIEGKVGIAKESPGEPVYHYLKEHEPAENEYTDGYYSICNRLHGSSTIVYDKDRVDLSDMRLCGHCGKHIDD